MPPHMGHCYLGDFGRSFVDELWIFVCSLPDEPIPGHLRFQWMRQLFPDARVIHIEEVNPAANRYQAGAQKIWANAVLERVQAPVDFVFASENYGWEFAEALGASFVPVDPSRDQFPISGSILREKPFRHWHQLPKVVRPWFVRTVALDQAEDDETLLRECALLMQTVYVPSYPRFHAAFAPDRPGDPDLLARAQRAQHEALRSQARHFLFCSRSAMELLPYQADLTITCTAQTTSRDIQSQVLDHWSGLF